MTISNIGFIKTEENTGAALQGMHKDGTVGKIESGIALQPGVFLEEGADSAGMFSAGEMQEKAKSILEGRSGNHAEFLTNSMTPEMQEELKEQGISASEEDVDVIVTVVDKIQLEMAKSGKNIAYGQDFTAEQIKEVVGSGAMAYEMAGKLKELKPEHMAYLMDNEMAPTIGNIYQAQSCVYGTKSKTPLEDGMRGQIEERVAEFTVGTGNKPQDSDVELAMWMVSSGVELTKEHLQYAKDLKQLNLPPMQEVLDEGIRQAIVSGYEATDAMLLSGYSPLERSQKTEEIIAQATEYQVVSLWRMEVEVNIANLADLQGKGEKLNEDIISKNSDVSLISARRLLEETRLYMTTKANLALLRKGISIETKPLEELVENLKQQEQEYLQAIYKENPEGEEIFSALKAEVRQFAQAPAYALPRISFGEMTLKAANEEGRSVEAELRKANQSYETMMTKPRADLGDTIKKAFRNVEELLRDIDYEVTPANERAARILGYNRMEINGENMQAIKLKDAQVQLLFSNMTPRVVLSMIREGYNPLEVSLEELNAKANEIQSSFDGREYDSYGRFLVELEQKQGITKQERDAYIGIYRLLHQVEKTDGAVIGAVALAEEELTLKNLMTQVRNRKAGGFDKTVSDETGMLSEDFSADMSVTRQIETVYQALCATEAKKQISVSKLLKATEKGNPMEMTPEQLLESFRESQGEVADAEAKTREYILQQEQQSLQKAVLAERQVMDMLQNLDLPKSPQNIMALQEMLADRNRMFKTLFGEKNKSDERKEALKEIKEQLLVDFGEAISTPEDMAKAQEALAETAENIMEDMMVSEDVTALDIRQLQRIHHQMNIFTAKAKREEFAVPVLVSDEFGMVSLKIVRGEKEEGKVCITLELEALGKLAATFYAGEKSLSGYVVVQQEAFKEKLMEQEEALRESIRFSTGLNVEVGSISYVTEAEISFTRFEAAIGQYRPQEVENKVQTKTLYGVAKEFLKKLNEI